MAQSNRSPILFLNPELLKRKLARETSAALDAKRDIEVAILRAMAETEISRYAELNKLCEELMDVPLGQSSLEFIHSIKHAHLPETTKIWRLIETYLVHAKYDVNSASADLKMLESTMKARLDDRYALGPRRYLFNPNLIRRVYMTENEPLIQVFKKLLPMPTPAVFEGHIAPHFILEQERMNTLHVLNFLKERTIEAVEGDVTKIQRWLRAQKRQKMETDRIPRVHGEWVREFPDKRIAEIMQEANTRYFPQCRDKFLAYRIFAASARVKLFSTLKHLTSKKALKSILDDGLYGRETLEHFYMSYSPAVLDDNDVERGDKDVICLGPDEIDYNCKEKASLEIVFDFEKIDRNNRCIFYKQRDFGYATYEEKEITIGNATATFSHPNTNYDLYQRSYRYPYPNSLEITFSGKTAYSELPDFLFMSNNVEHIHQILTLNFFRFLDRVTDIQGDRDLAFSEEIYSQIATLNDDELVQFLTELGKAMVQTAEFNFYGAHKIDIATVLTFTHDGFTLTMADFIKQLEAGDMEAFRTAQKNIPQLFQSYRFVDYLLSAVSNQSIKSELTQLRKQCTTSFWREMKEKNIAAKDFVACQEARQERARQAAKR